MDKSAIFNDTFEKCLCGHYDAFFERFYDEFERRSPQVQRAFKGTDPQRRYDMLEESILILVDYSVHLAVSKELRKLAELHARFGLEAGMFDDWLDALLVTLREVDSEFGDVDAQAWREVLSPGVEYMKCFCSGE